MSTARDYRPGDRVRLDREDGTVVPNGTPVTVATPVRTNLADCVKVREDGIGGPVRWWNRSRMTLIEYAPIATQATEYPIGATVHDVKYDLLGTVVSHRASTGFPVVEFPAQGSTIKHQAEFPDPVGRLERVHILTHEELTTIDEAVGLHKSDEAANQIIGKHLRPTVTDRFVLTVERPADWNPAWFSAEGMRSALAVQLGPSAKVTVAPATKEQAR